MLSIQSVAQTPKTIRPVAEAFGLEIGDPIRNFTANDIHHQTYSLDDALVNGPVVLIFIRGQWCPFCNKHLSQIQDSLPLIYAKGASVVVISPEKSEFIAKTIEKTGAEFTILYDEDYRISDAFDVTFKPDSITRTMVNMMLGAQLKDSHSDDTERLPIPATYIINQNRTIKWRHFDRNYKKRSNLQDVINNL